MPNIPGRKKYHGFISPAPPQGAPSEMKDFMAKTYGNLRSLKYPGESKENKTRAAKLTWYQTKRKFPWFFKKVSGKELRAEMREHPQFTRPQARQIVIDHRVRGDNTNAKSRCQTRSRRNIARTPAYQDEFKNSRKKEIKNIDLQEARISSLL